MPVTSMRTPRADVGAPYAPSMNGFSRRPTCTAAVVIPIIDAEIDRGSMSGECKMRIRTMNTEEDIRGQEGGRMGRVPAQPYTNPHSGHLGVNIGPSLVLISRA